MYAKPPVGGVTLLGLSEQLPEMSIGTVITDRALKIY